MKKITALTICFVLALALTACGKNENNNNETAAASDPVQVTEAIQEEKTNTVAEEKTNTVAEVSDSTSTTNPMALHHTYPVIVPNKELIRGIQPVDINQFDPDPAKWTTQQIIDYYKFGMAMEDNSDVMTDQSFELIGGMPALLEGPVKLAMKLGAQPYNALTGGYWAIQPSDLKSADAHREGDYIIINLYPKDQTDGPNGDEHEGTVGHVLNVVQGIDEFIAYVEKNFSILNAKYDDDSVVLKYSNARGTIKINTKTGKMETGNWSYTLDVYLDHCSLAGVDFENFHTTIGWKCWYPVG